MFGIGEAIQTVGSLMQQKRQRKHNLEMADYQYAQDLEMWNRQNEYNLPSAQMQRLKDAGLNPNLMYGKGAGTGTTGSAAPSTLPKYSRARQDYSMPALPNMMNIMSQWHDIKLKKVTEDNIRSQTDLNTMRKVLAEGEANKLMALLYGKQYNWYMKDSEGNRIKMDLDKSPFYKSYMSEIGRTQKQAQQMETRNRLFNLDMDYYFLNKVIQPLIGTGSRFIKPR